MSFTSKIGSLASRAYGWSAAVARAVDQYFEYVTLLLPGTGTNGAQNNTFLDGSTNNFTITRNGNTTQGTFSPFSQTGWGGYFSGAANYLSVAATTSIDLASSDFTIECWAYPGTQTNAVDSVFGYGGFTTMLYRNGTTWSWEVGNGSSANYFTITATVTPNAWQHIALTRSGNTFTFWINGSSAGTNSTANAVGTASKSLTIGYNNTSPSAQYFTGYISNFRLTKGRAVYTGAFTPPTIPLTRTTGGTNPPQGTECSLLTCQSNRFLDSNGVNTPASSPLTITPNGSPAVVAFSPFNPTASWSAATYGGSGYFDGSSDYLTVPDNAAFAFGSGAVTIETWAYFNTTISSFVTLLAQSDNASAAGSSFIFVIDTSGKVNFEFYYGSSALTLVDPDTVPINQWVHLAVARNASNTISLYVNGNRKATNSSFSASVNDSSQTVSLGGRNSGIQPLNGYLSNSRIVKGTAVYDPTLTTLTVPTAPLTNITNTSLLLNFTNAGIYDATSKNDLETVGNAQISTAQSKWGGSSMSFDGTGDWLLSNASTDLYAFGTGDFTIEFWLRHNNTGTQIILYDSRPATTNGLYPTIYKSSGNVLVFYTNSADRITGATSLSANTWYHVALSRSGTSTRLFLDGNQQGSTYTDSNNYINPTARPLIGGDGYNGNSSFNGYMQDVRITKGYARYTANFTAPTAAFPTL